jgi:hypothetical protein
MTATVNLLTIRAAVYNLIGVPVAAGMVSEIVSPVKLTVVRCPLSC